MKKNTLKNVFLKYISQAKSYLNDQHKLASLLDKATTKANGEKNILGEAWDQLHLLFQCLRSYMKGDYRKVPVKSLLTMIACILYFVTPTDAIPDFIMGFGYLDDTAVLAFTFRQVAEDVEQFRQWQQEKDHLHPL
ncbi:YkvA family protein [Bacillus testis]|uniref:YkvA family protein n=1 Tax=Bacillus testis TaxID=1622072 RepID=UPI00067F568E|nr:YkvA family protein [Bacillus testis]